MDFICLTFFSANVQGKKCKTKNNSKISAFITNRQGDFTAQILCNFHAHIFIIKKLQFSQSSIIDQICVHKIATKKEHLQTQYQEDIC